MPFGDPNNFVSPEGGGFRVYVNGNDMGWFPDQASAEQAYNAASGGATGGGGGGDETTYAPLGLMSLHLQAAQQKYLQQRLNLLEIPEMQARTELERHRLALQSASDYSRLSGYLIPPGQIEAFINGQLGQYYVGAGTPNERLVSLDDMRRELAGAGYAAAGTASPQEIASVFGRTVQGGLTQQTGLPPTFEREQAVAQALAAPQTVYQGLALAGLSRPQIMQFLQQSPLLRSIMQRSGSVLAPAFEERNVAFAGRQLPVRQTLEAGRTGSPLIPFLGATASYLTGQTPQQFFGEFEEFLPKGPVAPLTRFL